MPQLILSIDGVVIKEFELTKERTTLGRRPYNDIVIEHPTVSGEHAALHLQDGTVELQDLDSTNGSHVNGRSVKRQVLASGDLLEMGRHQIRFLQGDSGSTANAAGQHPQAQPSASVQVLNGNAAGREVALTKVVTTIGKPGTAIASITRRQHGFVLAHVEGPDPAVLNGAAIDSATPTALSSGDLIELAGTQMRFVQADLN